MAYQTGTASSMNDLVSQLFTFATGNGWTQDKLDTANGQAALHKDNVFVSFRWNTATPLHLAIYQALGYGIGVSTATIVNAGTGYVVGDILTISGGTKTTAGTLKVMAVGGGGAITTIRVESAGVDYTVNPGNPVSVTGGTGTAATFNLTFTGVTSGSANSGEHCDDSGNGVVTNVNSSLEQSRSFHNIGNGPYTSYHFFLNTNPDYIHVVLQYSAGLYRHGGWGELAKKGDWHGGEYCYGHTHRSGTPTVNTNTCLLDAIFSDQANSDENEGATIHVQSLPNMAAASKWGICWGVTGVGFTTDRAGNAKVRTPGSFRGGMISRAFAWIRSSLANGFIPMVQIAAWYWDISVGTPNHLYLLGFMPDVRSLDVAAFTAGQEFVVDGQTWIAFPTVRKQNLGVVDESRNQGMAYLKVP